MSPQEVQFEQDVRKLMVDQGCSLEDAFQRAMQHHNQLANQADRLLIIKQKIQRDTRSPGADPLIVDRAVSVESSN